MPVLIPLLGLAAGAAGTGLSIAGGLAQQDALDKTRQQEAAQQRMLSNKARWLAQKNILASSPDNASNTLDKGAQERSNLFKALQNASEPIATALPATGRASTTAKARNGSWADLVTGAADRIGSQGDLANKWSINNADTNTGLGVLNRFSQQDASILPLEMQVAGQAGDSLNTWAGITSALGSAANLARPSLSATGVTPLSSVGNYPGTASMLNGAGASARVPRLGNIWSTIYS